MLEIDKAITEFQEKKNLFEDLCSRVETPPNRFAKKA
jgi:hypothetical protein